MREFLPGHGLQLRSELEARLGGVLALRELVDASAAYVSGQATEVAFTERVRTLMFTAAAR